MRRAAATTRCSSFASATWRASTRCTSTAWRTSCHSLSAALQNAPRTGRCPSASRCSRTTLHSSSMSTSAARFLRRTSCCLRLALQRGWPRRVPSCAPASCVSSLQERCPWTTAGPTPRPSGCPCPAGTGCASSTGSTPRLPGWQIAWRPTRRHGAGCTTQRRRTRKRCRRARRTRARARRRRASCRCSSGCWCYGASRPTGSCRQCGHTLPASLAIGTSSRRPSTWAPSMPTAPQACRSSLCCPLGPTPWQTCSSLQTRSARGWRLCPSARGRVRSRRSGLPRACRRASGWCCRIATWQRASCRG
mmetsp:Transcript_5791/g.17677  ORF Transcript_5791/g.17677 Transcript_5791/m.17677 type:complete len:306 (+) Transcript_5791:707-1624(+)